jgi:hypothetical protein
MSNKVKKQQFYIKKIKKNVDISRLFWYIDKRHILEVMIFEN